ncbi:MAG: hypothetical protein DI556_19470 [Rhodovulum sulfidophilum]|uniref:VPDSG-CTERM protein sorting domain-containing protein n=1 Tax=Rhodovulum sulfidophilum TaxID=35806 RepID=A0A2W5N223_RHOSU|nr:MAG: hypothetical protein DI556_19470 [Rhodovulum sulfidophilum]
MNDFLKVLLVSAAATAAPVAASAVDYVDNFVISADTEELAEQRRLSLGDTWTTNYTLGAGVQPFNLDLVFSGNASITGVLSNIRYGIGSATFPYERIENTGIGTGRVGEGTITDTYIDGPFSIIYTYTAGSLPTRTALVNFTGTMESVPTSVPEIGAKGALSAMLLVMGGIAVMTGTRRRGGPVAFT